MHAKTNSEVTSSAASSPDHNRRPVYYVQSPSHDGDKTATMTPNSHSSVGHHSRESSTSCISASRPRQISQNNIGSVGRAAHSRNHHALDQETGLCVAIEARQGCAVRFLVSFLVLFSLLALILWAAARSHKPKIAINSITFRRFEISQGSHDMGYPTFFIFMSSTVKFTFITKAKPFGVHVTSTPLTLSYYNLPIGSGNMEKFYQAKNEDSTGVVVAVNGSGVPLNGAGYELWTTSTTKPVRLNLGFTVRSRAYVVGKLVKSTFYKKIECSVVFDLKKLNAAISLKNSCS